MKIAVVAANGRSGKAFVEIALAQGHNVRAGIYGKDIFSPHERLEVMDCDATDETDIAALLKQQDAVVSFIGHVKNSPPHVQTEAMRTVTHVMEDQGLRRIISLTGTGVRFAGDRITFLDRLLNLGISMIDPARVMDGRDHVEVLKQSGLDWTVVRVLKLRNISPKPFTLLAHGPTKNWVSREDVAKAVLQILEDKSFVHEAPILG